MAAEQPMEAEGMSDSSAAESERAVRAFERYPAYRDSGVEWLGEIPAHWEANRTKFAARLRSGHTPSRQHDEYWQDCTIPWFGLADVWQIRDGETEYVTETSEKISELGLANSAARLLPKGTVMLSRTASVGFSTIMGVDMATTQDFVNWVCGPTLRPEYLLYVFRSMHHEFRRLTMGSTHQTIYMPDVGRFSTPIPPVSEQDQVVAFVRKQTARIDALVAKKERLIELLQEKRTARITRAVTKGLDPNVAMKDSGIEWLGQIPAHWVVKKVKRLCLVRRGASPRPIDDPIYFDDEGEYAWVRIADVTASDRYLERTTQRLSSLGKSKSVALEPGELFVSIAATVGKPVITKIKCCIHDGFVYFVGLHDNREFLFYLFSCGEPYKGLGKLGTQLNLNTDTIGDIYLPRPSGAEQEVIVQFLDRETANIDALIAKVRTAIERLRELRTALISAAVTGKIDVRELS